MPCVFLGLTFYRIIMECFHGGNECASRDPLFSGL